MSIDAALQLQIASSLNDFSSRPQVGEDGIDMLGRRHTSDNSHAANIYQRYNNEMPQATECEPYLPEETGESPTHLEAIKALH